MRDAVGNLLTDGQLWGHDLRSLGSFRAHLVNRILHSTAGISRWQLFKVQSCLLAGLRSGVIILGILVLHLFAHIEILPFFIL